MGACQRFHAAGSPKLAVHGCRSTSLGALLLDRSLPSSPVQGSRAGTPPSAQPSPASPKPQPQWTLLPSAPTHQRWARPLSGLGALLTALRRRRRRRSSRSPRPLDCQPSAAAATHRAVRTLTFQCATQFLSTLCRPKKAISVGKLSDLSTAGAGGALRSGVPGRRRELLPGPQLPLPRCRACALPRHYHRRRSLQLCACAVPQRLGVPTLPANSLPCRPGCRQDSGSGDRPHQRTHEEHTQASLPVPQC